MLQGLLLDETMPDSPAQTPDGGGAAPPLAVGRSNLDELRGEEEEGGGHTAARVAEGSLASTAQHRWQPRGAPAWPLGMQS